MATHHGRMSPWLEAPTPTPAHAAASLRSKLQRRHLEPLTACPTPGPPHSGVAVRASLAFPEPRRSRSIVGALPQSPPARPEFGAPAAARSPRKRPLAVSVARPTLPVATPSPSIGLSGSLARLAAPAARTPSPAKHASFRHGPAPPSRSPDPLGATGRQSPVRRAKSVVQDLSRSDPYAAMERALADALSHLRGSVPAFVDAHVAPHARVVLAPTPQVPARVDVTLHEDTVPQPRPEAVAALLRPLLDAICEAAVEHRRRPSVANDCADDVASGPVVTLPLGAAAAAVQQCRGLCDATLAEAAAAALAAEAAAEASVMKGHTRPGRHGSTAAAGGSMRGGSRRGRAMSGTVGSVVSLSDRDPLEAPRVLPPSLEERRASTLFLRPYLDACARAVDARQAALLYLRTGGPAFCSVDPHRVTGAEPGCPPLPALEFSRGLSAAARDIAVALSADGSSAPPLREACSHYGAVGGTVAGYVLHGVWHDATTAVRVLLNRWGTGGCLGLAPEGGPLRPMSIGSDRVLLGSGPAVVGVGWQRSGGSGAATVVIVAPGYHDATFVRANRHLPVSELRRLMARSSVGPLHDTPQCAIAFRPASMGLRPVAPLTHPLPCGPLACAEIACPPQVVLACVLVGPGGAPCSDRCVCIDRTAAGAVLSVALPTPTPHTLVLHGRRSSAAPLEKAGTIELRPALEPWVAAPEFPELTEALQAVHGRLVAPRCGTLLLGTPQAAGDAALPPGVALEPHEAAGVRGGSAFVFSALLDAEVGGACVAGAHGRTALQRVDDDDSGGAAWFYAVLRPKPGAEVALWVDGRCCALWRVAAA